MTADPLGEVTSFLDKPSQGSPLPPEAPALLASMGIYLFRFEVLREVLGEDAQRPIHPRLRPRNSAGHARAVPGRGFSVR